MLNKVLQDVQFGADLKCGTGCKAGILVRAHKQADGSLSGLFVPYGEGDTGLFMVTIDASGRETSRAPLAGGGIGNMVRYAPPPPDPERSGAGRPGRGAGAPGCACRGAAPPAGVLPARTGGRTPRGTRTAGRGGSSRGPHGRGRGPVFTPSDWNDVGVIADVNTLRKLMNGGVAGSQAVDMSGFGMIALYVGRHLRRPAIATCPNEDVGLKRFPAEKTSASFTRAASTLTSTRSPSPRRI